MEKIILNTVSDVQVRQDKRAAKEKRREEARMKEVSRTFNNVRK